MSGEDVLIGLRLIQYAGACLFLGVPLFLLGAGRGMRAPRARPAVIAAAAATAGAALLALVAQTAVMAGSWTKALDGEALSMVALNTGLGLSMLVRAGAALAVGLIAAAVRPARTRWGLASLAGVVAAASFAWSGHAGTAEGAGALLHPVADAAHAVAGATWLGALACLATIGGSRAAHDPATPRAFAAFSTVGTGSVGVLAVTGAVNAVFLVGPERLGQLATGLWGQLLLAKLALFVLMLALAASNRWRLTPALAAAQVSGDPGPALARLRRSVALELLAGLALLAVVAALGVQPPPARL
ncbi:MAG TPA: copper homeostasis membrane protein CopD [Brevundimonas sp.]|uniref:copper homeostasis membrane protein CopD n=1 Tax=Brevundimonas sp. TaxID=1871086 RepID=UPI002DE57B2C|nr:copper homeostasis membrane protein CopD [Brevundimonas sp.]